MCCRSLPEVKGRRSENANRRDGIANLSVLATVRFERDYGVLLKGHPDLAEHFAEAVAVLKKAPHNRSRRHPIMKLQGIAAGDGQ